ncbi:MAG TPA: hypothetical protein VF628_12900 [Allosphingosinicella sp.]
MSPTQKLLRIFLIAIPVSLSGGVSFAVESFLWAHVAGADVALNDLRIAIPAAIFAIPIAIVAGAVLAVPVPWLLSRLDLNGPVAYLAAGAFFGALAYGMTWVTLGASFLESFSSATGVLAGATAGLLWWFAVERHEQEASADG